MQIAFKSKNPSISMITWCEDAPAPGVCSRSPGPAPQRLGLRSSLICLSVMDGVRTRIISADAHVTLEGVHGDGCTSSDSEASVNYPGQRTTFFFLNSFKIKSFIYYFMWEAARMHLNMWIHLGLKNMLNVRSSWPQRCFFFLILIL